MRGVSKIVISLCVTIMIVGTSVFIVYKPSSKAETNSLSSNDTHPYIVNWVAQKSVFINHSGYVSKRTDFEKTISFPTPNLKEITFDLRWTDDKTSFLGRYGLDTFQLEVTTPDGDKIVKSARSSRITRQGQIEIIIPRNEVKPTDLILNAENVVEAGNRLNNDYFDYTWVNENFTVKISVNIGEIRPLKRLVDGGNEFQLTINSWYYHASLNQSDLANETATTNSDPSYKKTGYVPPDMCPFCDGIFDHEPWCPYYEDPFEDDHQDDHWSDPWNNDQWNGNDHQGFPVKNPLAIILMYFILLLFMKLGTPWVL